VTVILDQFIHTLVESGLMTKEEISIFIDGLPPEGRPSDGEQLAKLLFQWKKLTKFQTQAIYQGKTKGLVIGNYLVLDKIGQGGMGHVYKARHKRMKRVVALKVLPSAMTKTPEAVQRFEREVEVIAKLEHPNIVTAHDADEADGVHFLVMQYVQGSDLAELVHQKGALSVATAIDYLIQAGRGLDYAHAKGVIHRDIKPSNLLLDNQGTVKILDMGLARLEREVGPLDSTAAASLTQSGQVMGTVDYMPPEQSMDTHRADLRADVYSLGCTLYYLLTGRVVFAGDTLAKKIMAHREKAIPSLRALRPDVPAQLDVVFQKMLAKRPEDRQSKMSEVLTDLEACRAVVEDGVEETITYRGEASETGTTNTGHDATVERDSSDSVLEHWLKEELPAGPTQFISQPRKKHRLSRQQIVIGSVAAAVCFVLLCLGVVVSMKTAKGTVMVTVNEPGAEILIDDGKIALRSANDSEPVAVEIVEGQHTLIVSKSGFQKHTEKFTIESGGSEAFDVELLPLETTNARSGKPEEDSPESGPQGVADRPPSNASPDVWKALLPSDAPTVAIAPFDASAAKRHQEAWAKYLDKPIEQVIDLAEGVELTMVLIPPGEFLMGSTTEEQARFLREALEAGNQWTADRISTERPQHWVQLTEPFYLGKCEVTQSQWEAVMGSNPSRFKITPSHPVEHVSWNDVQSYVGKLNESGKGQGMRFTLPTEAQWEYACRAGTATTWHWGDSDTELVEHAWCGANAGGTTHPVGLLKPNAWRLCDMHGNVWEWCADRWAADYYAKSPLRNPSGPATGSRRVDRGASWDAYVRHCRSTYRDGYPPEQRGPKLGFRIALVLADE